MDIDIGLNAYHNAEFYYTSKKKVGATPQFLPKATKGATRNDKDDFEVFFVIFHPTPWK